MEFLRILAGTALSGSGSVSLALFALSAILLVTGMAVHARSRAMRLTAIEHMSLKAVEYTHPHLPSPRVIVAISVCAATLLAAALQTVQGAFPFTDPYQGLNLASFFLVGTSAGILAELRWKGAKEYAFAVILGTAIAFLCIIVLFSAPPKTAAEQLVLVALLLPSIASTGALLPQGHRAKPLLLMALTATAWIGLFLLR